MVVGSTSLSSNEMIVHLDLFRTFSAHSSSWLGHLRIRFGRCRYRGRLPALLFLFCLTATASNGQEPFAYLWVDAGVEAVSFGDLSWVDVDRDGDQDLLLLGSTGLGGAIPSTLLMGQVSTNVIVDADGIRRASSDMEQLAGFSDAPSVWLANVAWTDIDGDGFADAVVSGASNVSFPYEPSIRLYRHVGGDAGDFTESLPGFAPVLGDVSWADVDNDGADDLLVVGTSAGGEAVTSLFRNDRGNLVAMTTTLADLQFGSSAWTDVDNDGDMDVALCGATQEGRYSLAVYRNDRGGNFAPLSFDSRGLIYCSLDWGDYDGDGFDDLLVTGNRIGPTEVATYTDVYRNADGSRFVRQPFDLVGLTAGEGRFVDVNNDGFLDVLVVGGSDVAFRRALAIIYEGDGSDFRRSEHLPGTFPGAASIGDFDDDGDPDLAVIGQGQDRQPVTALYLNATLEVNSPPARPTGLGSDVDADRATLSWDPASDENTPVQSLTYNLRVGTSSGANDIMSVPTRRDGVPVRSSRGNVVHNISWTLEGLVNGTYFWSVQGIDNGLAASPFSEEGSFEITASAGGKPVGVDAVTDLPRDVALLPAWPNPFSDVATITFDLPQAGFVSVEVFDLVGRRVARPVTGMLRGGRHAVNWDAGDGVGGRLASGLYMLRLTFEQERHARMIAIQR